MTNSMSVKKKKRELYHIGACMALVNYADEFIERNPYSMLGWAFWRHSQHIKRKYAIELLTPSERHAYERGKKCGRKEREQIARRPIELLRVINCGVCRRNDDDVALIHAEISPDQYDVFYAGCDRTGLSYVNVYFNKYAPIRDGDMAAVWLNGRYLLCNVKHANNTIELYDPRNNRHLTTVQASDHFSMIGKLDSSGRNFVYPKERVTI